MTFCRKTAHRTTPILLPKNASYGVRSGAGEKYLLVFGFDCPLLDDKYSVRGWKEAHGDDDHDGRGEAVDGLFEDG